MEEDIKILKEIKQSIDTDYGTGRRKVQAIDNVINKVKELEEQNNNIRDTNSKLYEYAQGKAIQEILSDNYVPKSKVKELREINNIDLLQFKIKELLEE